MFTWFRKIFGRSPLYSKYVLSLDIGTEFVKTIVFEVDKEKELGIVKGVARTKQKLGDMQNACVTDIAGVIKACEKSIHDASEMAKFKPEQAILGIAGELVKGTTSTVHYERSKPLTKIDRQELNEIVKKVQWRAFDRVRKQLAWETGHKEIDVKLINAAIVDVHIDGYRVTNPLGFQGKDVSISVFNAYAPLVHLGALQTIASELDLDLLSIAAEPYAVARCKGIDDAIEFSAVFLDIGGGTTDIALVRNGGVEGTKMFALGGRAFTKRLAIEFGIDFDDAEKVKIKYSKGTLPPEIMKRVRNILTEDIAVWRSGVELALTEFSPNDLVPSRMLMCGGGSALPGLSEALQDPEWVKTLPFARIPNVNFISPEHVVNIKDETGLLKEPRDVTPMALANLAIDLAGEEEMLSGILRKVVRTIQS